jgi:ribonuclease E
MKKEMLINVLQPEECRIAILEDGVLEELYVERTSHESYVGNIYKGRIVNIEPSIQAAFVDFGVGRNGFLHVSDVEPAYYRHLEGRRPDNNRRGNGRDRFRSGDRGPDRDRGPERERRPDRDRGPDRGRPPVPLDEEPRFDEVTSEAPEFVDLESDPTIQVEPVEQIVNVETETIQFGMGVLDDPSEISLLGSPASSEGEETPPETGDLAASEEAPAEEEDAPRGRRRPRGGAKRRRGRSNKKVKGESEPAAKEGSASEKPAKRDQGGDDEPPKPRLM